MSRVYTKGSQPSSLSSVAWAKGGDAPDIQQPDWATSGDGQKVRIYRFPSLTGEPDPLTEESPDGEQLSQPSADETSPEAEEVGLADAEPEPEPDPEALIEAAKEQGWAKGFAQGEQAARTQFSNLAGAISSLQSLGTGLHDELGDAVVRLACRIASHVLEAEVDAAPELLIQSILRAVKSLEGVQSVTIRLHPDDLALVEAAGAASGETGFGALRTTLVADSSLQRGGYVVDSSGGGIDGDLGRRIAVIEEQLLALDDEGVLDELLPHRPGAAAEPATVLPADSESSEEKTDDSEDALDSGPGSGEGADD